MYNIELHGIITKIIRGCRYFSTWDGNEDETKEVIPSINTSNDIPHRFIRRASTCYRKSKKLFLSLYYFSFVASLASGAYLCDDRIESIFLLVVAIMNLVLSTKLYYMCWQGKIISEILHDVSRHSISDRKEFIQVNNKLENFVKFAKVFLLMTAIAQIFLCLPVFSKDKKLPFNVWFPLDWKSREISYWIAYTYLVTETFMAFIVTTFNIVVWYIMLNCSIKYQILGNQIRNMGELKSEETTTVKNSLVYGVKKQKIFLCDLIGLVKIHRNIEELVHRVKMLLSNLILVMIITSGICIGASIYVLAFSGNITLIQLTIYFIVLSYNFFDIFMVLNFGNEIKLNSDRLSRCLFESNWIEQSTTSKKCVIILTEILRRPHELVIFKLYRLNLQTFTSILNLSYSLFNIATKFD